MLCGGDDFCPGTHCDVAARQSARPSSREIPKSVALGDTVRFIERGGRDRHSVKRQPHLRFRFSNEGPQPTRVGTHPVVPTGCGSHLKAHDGSCVCG